jgi:hypothetical protein
VLVPVGFWVGFLCSLRVGLGFFVLVGIGSRGFVWWASFFIFLGCFFSIFSFAFSLLVYCRCTKGRLTLLIKSVYYLSKKIGVNHMYNFLFFIFYFLFFIFLKKYC